MTAAAATLGTVTTPQSRRPARETTVGTATMVRLVIRRNRSRLLVWIVVVVGLFAYVANYYTSLFATQQSLDDFAAVSNTPGIKALTGLAAAPNTLGGAVWTKIWMTCAVSLALGVVFLTTRNGRAEEETGRMELIRSRTLGVHASSIARYAVLGLLCVIIGLGVSVAAATIGLDPPGTGMTGSMIIGASITGVGFVALGVAAVAGELASTARGANMLASSVIGVFYVVRMVGDLNGSGLTWVSPIGWGEKMEPWGSNVWWPFALQAVVGAGLIAVAISVEARRDLASGLITDRPGPAAAPASLSSPLGLALRLQRGPLIGWTATIVLASLLFGSVIQAMTKLLADSGASAITGGSGTAALVSLLVMLLGLVVAVFALHSTMQLRSDEASGVLEPQLAGAVSRARWAGERLLIPVVGSAALLAVSGTLMGVVYGALVGDSSKTAQLTGASISYWPAVMVLVGVGVALFGWFPRLSTPITWGLLGLMWVLVLVGDAFHLPGWFLDSMPFQATPYLPYEPMTWTPLISMTGIAAALFVVGLAGFARRDIETG